MRAAEGTWSDGERARGGAGGIPAREMLEAGGARAFPEAAHGTAFRYRNAPLRRMITGEFAAAIDPGRVHDYDLLGAEGE